MIRVVAICVLAACGIPRAIDHVADSIDRAIDSLERQTTTLDQALGDAIADVEHLTAETRAELQHMLDSAVEGLGQEARCTVDFVKVRVKESLIELKSSLIGGRPYVRRPVFCVARPSSIDLVAWRDGRVPSIQISGYDLDTASLTTTLQERDRELVLPAKAIVNHVGPYQLVINLRDELVPLRDSTLQVVFGGSLGPPLEVAVTKPPVQGCDEVQIEAAIPDIQVIATHLVRGDADLNGHGPSYWAAIDVFAGTGSQLTYRIRFRATETRSDWTTIEGTKTGALYELPTRYADYDIVGIVEGMRSETPGAVFPTTFAPGGPVKQLTFVGDRNGIDVGFASALATFAAPLHLKLQRVRNCQR